MKFDEAGSIHWKGKTSIKTDKQFYFFEPEENYQNEDEFLIISKFDFFLHLINDACGLYYGSHTSLIECT